MLEGRVVIEALFAFAPMSRSGLIGRWSPGIGDPSFMGWLTVLAYFGTAWSCFSVARRLRTRHGNEREAWFWLSMAVLLAALGVNKQLDLQTAFTELGRMLAHRQGWYEHRRVFQRAFIFGVGLVALVTVAVALWLARTSNRAMQLAILGACFIVAFIVVRAASFHRVDRMLFKHAFGWLRLNWALELGGMAIVFVATRVRFAQRLAA
jgi:hypothetical protein